MVITRVFDGSQATRLRLQVGDIILRYQGQCLYDRTDLTEATAKTQTSQSVTLELWRQDHPLAVTASGGRLGLATATF